MISINLLCKTSFNKMLINYWGLFSWYSSSVCFPPSSTLLPQGGRRRDRKKDVVCNVFLDCWQRRVAWEPTGLWVPSFFPFFFLVVLWSRGSLSTSEMKEMSSSRTYTIFLLLFFLEPYFALQTKGNEYKVCLISLLPPKKESCVAHRRVLCTSTLLVLLITIGG